MVGHLARELDLVVVARVGGEGHGAVGIQLIIRTRDVLPVGEHLVAVRVGIGGVRAAQGGVVLVHQQGLRPLGEGVLDGDTLTAGHAARGSGDVGPPHDGVVGVVVAAVLVVVPHQGTVVGAVPGPRRHGDGQFHAADREGVLLLCLDRVVDGDPEAHVALQVTRMAGQVGGVEVALQLRRRRHTGGDRHARVVLCRDEKGVASALEIRGQVDREACRSGRRVRQRPLRGQLGGTARLDGVAGEGEVGQRRLGEIGRRRSGASRAQQQGGDGQDHQGHGPDLS